MSVCPPTQARGALLLTMLLSAGAACGKPDRRAEPDRRAQSRPPHETDEDQSAMPSPPCIEKITIDHSDSVLSEQRRVGPRADDFPTHFAAEVIDTTSYTPVAVVANYAIDATPLLWFTPDRSRAVVNSAYFTDLVVGDATQLKPGAPVTIGKLTTAAQGKLDNRQLARFLLAAGVIRTYWHIGAELCLVGEEVGDRGYAAAFTGVHTYFTNEENRDEFAFTLTLAEDGTLTISSD